MFVDLSLSLSELLNRSKYRRCSKNISSDRANCTIVNAHSWFRCMDINDSNMIYTHCHHSHRHNTNVLYLNCQNRRKTQITQTQMISLHARIILELQSNYTIQMNWWRAIRFGVVFFIACYYSVCAANAKTLKRCNIYGTSTNRINRCSFVIRLLLGIVVVFHNVHCEWISLINSFGKRFFFCLSCAIMHWITGCRHNKRHDDFLFYFIEWHFCEKRWIKGTFLRGKYILWKWK